MGSPNHNGSFYHWEDIAAFVSELKTTDVYQERISMVRDQLGIWMAGLDRERANADQTDHRATDKARMLVGLIRESCGSALQPSVSATAMPSPGGAYMARPAMSLEQV